jgi:hypothetical protein
VTRLCVCMKHVKVEREREKEGDCLVAGGALVG